MADGELARGIGHSLQVLFPGVSVLGHEFVVEETVDELVDHGFEKIRTSGNVTIQRHRLYFQYRSEAAHRELAETAGINEGDS
ncbi:hypothetical protein GCM10009690_13750 [Brevibacterium permense]|uniref:Uncharacterized protein n=1 Tax=Brevibacterium permense TaxID=234834 RepID=A0ABP4L227_9MICO